jgi:hypothetical protein
VCILMMDAEKIDPSWRRAQLTANGSLKSSHIIGM